MREDDLKEEKEINENMVIGSGEEWHCDTCGEVAYYRANGIAYCAIHWEDFLLKT